MPRPAVMAVMSAAVLLLFACGRLSEDDLRAARQAMRRAAGAGGVTRAPAPCAAAQAALVRAEAEFSLQAKRSLWSRDVAEAGRLAREARQAAVTCAARAGFAQERARTRAARALQELQALIERAAVLERHVRDGSGAKSDILEARLILGEARSSFERGEHERAEETAAAGRRRVAAAVVGINRFLDAYLAGPRRSAWRRMVLQTLHDSRRENREVILVDKLRRLLIVMRGDDEVVVYPIDIGSAGLDDKTRAGDDATPEGRYRVTEVRGPGQTQYHRAFMLDYPNDEDRERFRGLQRSGKVSGTQSIGSLIEIHGEGGRNSDWTRGCVALHNDEIDELLSHVRVGTRVTIIGAIPDGTLP